MNLPRLPVGLLVGYQPSVGGRIYRARIGSQIMVVAQSATVVLVEVEPDYAVDTGRPPDCTRVKAAEISCLFLPVARP